MRARVLRLVSVVGVLAGVMVAAPEVSQAHWPDHFCRSVDGVLEVSRGDVTCDSGPGGNVAIARGAGSSASAFGTNNTAKARGGGDAQVPDGDGNVADASGTDSVAIATGIANTATARGGGTAQALGRITTRNRAIAHGADSFASVSSRIDASDNVAKAYNGGAAAVGSNRFEGGLHRNFVMADGRTATNVSRAQVLFVGSDNVVIARKTGQATAVRSDGSQITAIGRNSAATASSASTAVVTATNGGVARVDFGDAGRATATGAGSFAEASNGDANIAKATRGGSASARDGDTNKAIANAGDAEACGGGNIATAGPGQTVSVGCTPVNTPPDARDDDVTTDEDTALNGDVLVDNGNGADADPDGDPLTVTAVDGNPGDVGVQTTLGSGALVTVNANGTFSYDPNGQFENLDNGDTATDTFTYTIDDGNGGTDTATVTVTITGITDNPPPIADPDSFSTNELQTVSSGPAVSTFGATGTALIEFQNPGGIAFIDNPFPRADQISIADTENNRMQTCDLAGTTCFSFDGTDPRFGGLAFNAPADVAIDASNNLFVADSGNDRIVRCRTFGSCSTSVGESGTDPGQFSNPRGVAVDPAGRIVVADTGNSRIQTCDFGVFPVTCTTFGSAGTSAGQFDSPEGVAVDASGNIIIVDTGNNRIQTCDPTGASCTAFGGPGSDPGQFNSPTAADVTASGDIVITDTGNDRLQTCDPSGVTCTVFDASNTALGSISAPARVIVDPVNGDVIFTDAGNDRVVTASTRTLLFNDSDPEGEPISVISSDTTSANGAAVSVNPDGSFTYDPTTSATIAALAEGATLVDTFDYTISDPAGGTDRATVSITVLGFGTCIASDAHLRAAGSVGGSFCVDAASPVVLTGGQIEVTSPLTLTSNGASNAVIDGDSIDRVFIIVADLTLDDITVTGGAAPGFGFGGGVYLASASTTAPLGTLTLNGNTAVTGNSARTGAGIAADQTFASGAITMNGSSSVTGNTAAVDAGSAGGGVYIGGRVTLTMNDSATISGNQALGRGAGVLINAGDFVMNDSSSITGNTAGDQGGGVYFVNGGSIDLIGSATITSNTAPGGGGGIARWPSGSVAVESTVSITSNTVNNCQSFGGGIGGPPPPVPNCVG